jgi:hypothetical protein
MRGDVAVVVFADDGFQKTFVRNGGEGRRSV